MRIHFIVTPEEETTLGNQGIEGRIKCKWIRAKQFFRTALETERALCKTDVTLEFRFSITAVNCSHHINFTFLLLSKTLRAVLG
jgi:hypothetical protein